jgi:hypothetical protein
VSPFLDACSELHWKCQLTFTQRQDYAKDVLIWIALTWFRHWLGQRLISGRGHQAPDGGYSLYSAIDAGGEAYMDKAIISQFHNMFPMTKKALGILEQHLLEIKHCMSEWVKKSNLTKSNCQLNVQEYPVDYITSVEFEEGDFLWVVKKEEEDGTKTLKRGKLPGGNDIVQQNLEAARKHQEQSIQEVDSNDGSDEGSDDGSDDDICEVKGKNAGFYARGTKRIRF